MVNTVVLVVVVAMVAYAWVVKPVKWHLSRRSHREKMSDHIM
jgi:hypothetical protein